MQTSTGAMRLLLRVYIALFGIGALVFLFFSSLVVRLLNAAGDPFGMPHVLTGYRQFWIPLAVAYMVVIMELSWLGLKEGGHSRAVEFLFLAKLTSSLVALAYFLFVVHAFAFLANFAVDGVIALATFLLFRRQPKLATPTVPS